MVVDAQFHKFCGRSFARVLHLILMKRFVKSQQNKITAEVMSVDLLIIIRKSEKRKRFHPERSGCSRRAHGALISLSMYCRTVPMALGTNILE